MDELVEIAGDGEIEIALRWSEVPNSATGADATTGRLRLSLRGKPVWCGADPASGFEWSWIELLEYLGDSWLYLTVEEGTPLGVALDTAPRMRAAAEVAADTSLSSSSVGARDALEAFHDTHDLAEALQGAVFPPVWIVKEGLDGWVASESITVATSFAELKSLLEKVGNFIAKRLAPMNDQRSLQAVESWARRDSFTRFDLIEAATGFPVELVAELEPVFFSETDRDWSIPESDVLLAAARMVGPQSPEVLRPILAAVKGVGRTATPKLDLLSKGMSALLDQMSGEEPHEQGYRLAARLRAKPEVVDDHGRVDPGELLRSWNVTVSDVPLRLRDIDAIGCWGPERGPTILINADHKFADSTTRRRATLAHEIAHLLVDRQAALPLAEVLGGRTSESVEKRARAFAAELLLPRSLAAQEFLGHNGNYADAIGSIRKRFGVSGEIIAWQVKNSESFVPFEGLEQLSELVPDPSRYLAY